MQPVIGNDAIGTAFYPNHFDNGIFHFRFVPCLHYSHLPIITIIIISVIIIITTIVAIIIGIVPLSSSSIIPPIINGIRTTGTTTAGNSLRWN